MTNENLGKKITDFKAGDFVYRGAWTFGTYIEIVKTSFGLAFIQYVGNTKMREYFLNADDTLASDWCKMKRV